MNKNLKNHRLLYMLVPASVIIWVIIIHKIFWQISDFNTFSIPVVPDSGSSKKNIFGKPNYDSIFSDVTRLPDPFRPPVSATQGSGLQLVKKNILPRLRFTGYLNDGKTTLAILEINDQKTIISREGESVNGWKVNKIQPSQISIQYKDSVYIFRLNQ
jgi:hypothetical protein